MKAEKPGKKIAWFIPEFSGGSGGIRTILQNAKFLVENGYRCDFYVIESNGKAQDFRQLILEQYGIDFSYNVYSGSELKSGYDMAIATFNTTAKVVRGLNVPNKVYFVQDFEPLFYPASEPSIKARETYKYGLRTITIGRWLSNRISDESGEKVDYFDFCADLNDYKREEGNDKENAICFLYQPDKPRRCPDMGLKALQIIKKARPNVKIYLYGSQKMVPFNLDAEHLGILSTKECNALYNKCKVGICLSATNPSRIPFEMMASGLPVVDLYLDNNLYDEPECGCLLAASNAESIAEATIKLLDDKRLNDQMSYEGAEYMKGFPLEKGYDEFKHFIDSVFDDVKENGGIKNRKRYLSEPIFVNGTNNIKESVYFRSQDELVLEKRREKDEARKKTFFGKVYLKIRFITKGY